MLVIKFEIEPGVTEEITISTVNISRWINAHSIEDRFEIMTGVNLETDKTEDYRLLFVKTLDYLLKQDLFPPEVSILHSTLKSSLTKLEKKYKTLGR